LESVTRHHAAWDFEFSTLKERLHIQLRRRENKKRKHLRGLKHIWLVKVEPDEL